MPEVKAITHQVQVASLVSATAPTFAYVWGTALWELWNSLWSST